MEIKCFVFLYATVFGNTENKAISVSHTIILPVRSFHLNVYVTLHLFLQDSGLLNPLYSI